MGALILHIILNSLPLKVKSKFRPRARRNESRLKCIETQPGYISSPEAFFYVLTGGERGRGAEGGEWGEGRGERGEGRWGRGAGIV